MDSILKEELLFTRRNFLISSVYGLIAIPLANNGLLSHCSSFLKNNDQFFITSKNDNLGKSYITAIDIHGKSYFEIPVGHRCHATTFDPTNSNRAVVFPKRPGYISYLIDINQGAILKEIRARKDRFFYGHGSFSKDGRYLVATENDYKNKKGVISIWDGKSLDFLGEMESFGIGPHELVFSEDGKNIIVANGGIFEHPDVGDHDDKGRAKLNTNEMKPSLMYIDFESRKKLAEITPSDHLLGLRHLSLGNDGLVAIAIQSEDPKDNTSPLIAFYSGQDKLTEVLAPIEIQQQMKNFALSVVIDPKTGITCATCPKGDLVTFWDGKNAKFLSSIKVKDAGGAALYQADKPGFVITTGKGEIIRQSIDGIENPTPVIEQIAGTSFDNHLC